MITVLRNNFFWTLYNSGSSSFWMKTFTKESSQNVTINTISTRSSNDSNIDYHVHNEPRIDPVDPAVYTVIISLFFLLLLHFRSCYYKLASRASRNLNSTSKSKYVPHAGMFLEPMARVIPKKKL